MTQVRESFAKYKVEEVLGEGAMGVVYACYDSAIGRRVAIKTIHAHLLQGAEGEELRQRFSREIRAVGKLSHPNIVGIFDTDEAQDASGAIEPYFVMEFVDGQDLQAYLAGGTRFPLTKPSISLVRFWMRSSTPISSVLFIEMLNPPIYS